MLPPDPLVVLVALLRERLPHATAGTVVPDDLAERLPFVHLATTTTGISSPSWRGAPHAETAQVALTCWHGPDHADARDLARDALAVLLPARSLALPSGGVLVRVRHVSGPAFLPDPFAPSGAHRYAAAVAATTHP